jgi:heme-degrading monooxygenase HmoA
MFIAINHLAVTPEHRAALERRFADRVRLVDRARGFRSFELLRPEVESPDGRAEYLVVTRWANRAGFKAWVKGDAHRRAHRQGVPDSAGRSWLTTHEPFEVASAPGWSELALQAPAPVAMLNVIDLSAAFDDLFEAVFRDRERQVEAQPGFLSLEVLRPVEGAWHGPHGTPGERERLTYVVFSRWASAEAHAAWTRSEAFRRAHGRHRLPEGAILAARARAFRLLWPAYAPEVARVGGSTWGLDEP